ncbi:MAG: rRNA pseudouridine synthase [Flavobacteriaceae bacterium]|nr:rRNA pseudouridine synthase [Flavobacteriaceae bacterium]
MMRDSNRNSKGKGKYQKRKPAAKTQKPKQGKSNPDEIRLNKYIANSGICSRREADMHISIGSVTVNGKVVTEMGYKVKPGDEVRFDGSRISPEKKAYVLLNKPKGFATTTSETKGRTVMDLVANATNSRIKPIGRLGRGATGLLLFTNDDELTRILTQSSKGVKRLFHIELNRALKREDFDKIAEGIMSYGKRIEVNEISYIEGASKKEIGIEILNTGHSSLRTIFEHLEYEIVRLDCVLLHGLTKKDLPRGHWRHLTEQEIINLKHF